MQDRHGRDHLAESVMPGPAFQTSWVLENRHDKLPRSHDTQTCLHLMPPVLARRRSHEGFGRYGRRRVPPSRCVVDRRMLLCIANMSGSGRMPTCDAHLATHKFLACIGSKSCPLSVTKVGAFVMRIRHCGSFSKAVMLELPCQTFCVMQKQHDSSRPGHICIW